GQPSCHHAPAWSVSASASTEYRRITTTSGAAGKNIHQYEDNTSYRCRTASILPQLGTGSPTPRPKNDSVASARMYCGASSATCVNVTPINCGSTCLCSRWTLDAPRLLAATT